MICENKHVDPYKHELRHPTRPDEALNMASPLEYYGINEIYVVPLAGRFVLFSYINYQKSHQNPLAVLNNIIWLAVDLIG